MLTKTCERCDGNGQIEIVRDARLGELSDAQVKALVHADMFRETGGEEAQKQHEKAQRMQSRGAGGPSNTPTPRPTNKSGKQALSGHNV